MKASLFPNSAALVLIVLALGSLLMGQQYSRACAETPLYDLLITNARIVDGSDNPWCPAGVAVRGGVISQIGHLEDAIRKLTSLPAQTFDFARRGIALRGRRTLMPQT